MLAVQCLEQAEPRRASCQAGSLARPAAGGPSGEPSGAFRSLALADTSGKPTASCVDKHPQSPKKSSHLPRNHAARLGSAGSHCGRHWGLGPWLSANRHGLWGAEGDPSELRLQSQPGSGHRPPLTQVGIGGPGEGTQCPLLPCTGTRGRQLGLVRGSELGPWPAQPWGPSPSGNLCPGLTRGWLRS